VPLFSELRSIHEQILDALQKATYVADFASDEAARAGDGRSTVDSRAVLAEVASIARHIEEKLTQVRETIEG
jgi:hypothetical protein